MQYLADLAALGSLCSELPLGILPPILAERAVKLHSRTTPLVIAKSRYLERSLHFYLLPATNYYRDRAMCFPSRARLPTPFSIAVEETSFLATAWVRSLMRAAGRYSPSDNNQTVIVIVTVTRVGRGLGARDLGGVVERDSVHSGPQYFLRHLRSR